MRSLTQNQRKTIRRTALAYLLLGVALWPIPLFNVLHAESSAVVAGVAFFIAGLSAISLLAASMSIRSVLRVQLALSAIPWFLLTVTLVVIPNCGYGQGFLLFLLFVPVSVFLAASLAGWVQVHFRRPKRAFAWIAGFMLLGGVVFDLGFHPQFYLYNHVFGGVLGPIYDEELVLRPGLFAFRGVSILIGLACLTALRLHKRPTPQVKWSLAALIVVILIAYVFSARLGFNTTHAQIKRALGGVYHTEHFELIYDSDLLDEASIWLLAAEHEFRYQQLAGRLNEEVGERIRSYIYPSTDSKGQFTGARLTSVAPVWLRHPQMHIALEHIPFVLAHEMAHVFSRNFGMPIMRASIHVGLVEGLAVALEPPDGSPLPHDQVMANAGALADSQAAIIPLRQATRLKERFSPLGFWAGRGAVSYTTMGSFVNYLLEAYGAEPLKIAYAWGHFEEAYGKPLEALIDEWEQHLQSRPFVDTGAKVLAAQRFSRLSLFEQSCPHHVPSYERAHREAVAALEAADTLSALSYLDEALERNPQFWDAWQTWGDVQLAKGRHHAVIDSLLPWADSLAWSRGENIRLSLLLARALGRAGDLSTSDHYYARVVELFPAYAHSERALLNVQRGLLQNQRVQAVLRRDYLTPEARAEQLALLGEEDALVDVVLAHLWAGADQYRNAIDALDRAFAKGVDTNSSLHLLQPAWKAQWLAAQGDWNQASEWSQEAAEVFLQRGAITMAKRFADMQGKLLFMLEFAQSTPFPQSDTSTAAP